MADWAPSVSHLRRHLSGELDAWCYSRGICLASGFRGHDGRSAGFAGSTLGILGDPDRAKGWNHLEPAGPDRLCNCPWDGHIDFTGTVASVRPRPPKCADRNFSERDGTCLRGAKLDHSTRAFSLAIEADGSKGLKNSQGG